MTLRSSSTRKLWIPIVLVLVAAAAIWFAAPTAAFRASLSANPAEIIRNGYLPPGQLRLEKRDQLRGYIINSPGSPGVTFEIFPNPYNLLSPFPLTAMDNDANDHDAHYGVIVLINIPVGDYQIREVIPPGGYALDSTPQDATVQSGQETTKDFYDMPVTMVPASSNFSLWFLVGGFAILIVVFVVWRQRHNLIGGSGGAVK